jgi:hypothetical protein
MFYSYASALYAQQRRMALTAAKNKVGGKGNENLPYSKRDLPRAFARWMMQITIPMLVGEAIAGNWPDEDDEESFFAWLAKNLVATHIMSVPVIRDGVDIALEGRSQAAPLSRLMQPPAQLARQLVQLPFDDDPNWENLQKNTILTVGYLGGLPLGQIEVWHSNFLSDDISENQLRDIVWRRKKGDRR